AAGAAGGRPGAGRGGAGAGTRAAVGLGAGEAEAGGVRQGDGGADVAVDAPEELAGQGALSDDLAAGLHVVDLDADGGIEGGEQEHRDGGGQDGFEEGGTRQVRGGKPGGVASSGCDS